MKVPHHHLLLNRRRLLVQIRRRRRRRRHHKQPLRHQRDFIKTRFHLRLNLALYPAPRLPHHNLRHNPPHPARLLTPATLPTTMEMEPLASRLQAL